MLMYNVVKALGASRVARGGLAPRRLGARLSGGLGGGLGAAASFFFFQPKFLNNIKI